MPSIDLQLLKMASPPRFRKVCEEDVQNVLQSAIPEKKTKKATKYGIKIFKGKCRTISEIKCFI